MAELSYEECLQNLCQFPDRRLGSPDNQVATRWVFSQLSSLGWRVIQQQFDCIDWIERSAGLTVAGEDFEVYASPYTLPVDTEAELVCASTLEALEGLTCRDQILLLLGPITHEPLMPKNYPFYYPETHQRLLTLLEHKAPAAIVAATGRHPQLAGGVYPFSMLEDGNFDIPSAYLTDKLGVELSQLENRRAHLALDVERIPSHGANVIASRPAEDENGRIVICAHLDTKMGTPGALDNAAGVCVLLSTAQKLTQYRGKLGVDLVVFNGEDYYGANGELAYLKSIEKTKEDIHLAINFDAAGYIEGPTAYSLYGCSQRLTDQVNDVFRKHAELVPGEPWYQSDHMIFAQNEVPAMAITSQRFSHLAASITHTADDKPELVDPHKLEAAAAALVDLVEHLNRSLA